MAQIALTLPDNSVRHYDAGVTPAEVAVDISTSLGKKAISATVDGAHYDLQWPIQADASIAINTMADDAPALELIRHDLAHVMARAVQGWEAARTRRTPCPRIRRSPMCHERCRMPATGRSSSTITGTWSSSPTSCASSSGAWWSSRARPGRRPRSLRGGFRPLPALRARGL